MARFRVRPGTALVILTLFSHVLVAFGLPLPGSFAPRSKEADAPFPCQNRPCGCLSSTQCWVGDCCCFTLEEKLTWADANGVAPPDHVRPLVASRQSRPAPPEKRACCSEAADEPTCDPYDEASAPECCAPAPKAHEDRPRLRWVIEGFAQKCRGDGPAGTFTLEPGVVPCAPLDLRPLARLVDTLVDRPRRFTSTPRIPAIPPPRRA